MGVHFAGVEKLLSHFALQVGGYGYFLELYRGALGQPLKQLGEGAIALGEEFFRINLDAKPGNLTRRLSCTSCSLIARSIGHDGDCLDR